MVCGMMGSECVSVSYTKPMCDGVAGGVLLRCELHVRCLAPCTGVCSCNYVSIGIRSPVSF